MGLCNPSLFTRLERQQSHGLLPLAFLDVCETFQYRVGEREKAGKLDARPSQVRSAAFQTRAVFESTFIRWRSRMVFAGGSVEADPRSDRSQAALSHSRNQHFPQPFHVLRLP